MAAVEPLQDSLAKKRFDFEVNHCEHSEAWARRLMLILLLRLGGGSDLQQALILVDQSGSVS